MQTIPSQNHNISTENPATRIKRTNSESSGTNTTTATEAQEHHKDKNTDQVEWSGKTPTVGDKATTKTVGNGFADFDMDAFQADMRDKLLEMVSEAKKSAKESDVWKDVQWSDPIRYEVADDEEAAEVPEYWNSENTSQRIVDYAMSFRSLAPELSDSEYIEKMRDAALAGFKEAKDILGNLPGPVAKLFNDTYDATVKKFDELLKKTQGTTETEVDQAA